MKSVYMLLDIKIVQDSKVFLRDGYFFMVFILYACVCVMSLSGS